MSNFEVEFEYTGKEERKDVPKDVTIVRFHSSVTEVGDNIFREFRKLKEVVLNEGLRKIGCDSFRSCKLKSITFPSTIKEVDASAFCDCTSLKTVVLNKGLQTVGLAAFANCTSLEYITLPSTLNEISGEAFYECTSLREVGLHEGIHKITSDAFESCSSLERFKFPALSARLDTIIRAGQTEVEDKVEEIRGIVERRGSEMFISDAVSWVRRPNWWIPLKDRLGGIDRLLTYHELREATTLLELAIWKSRIDQAKEATDINHRDVYLIDIPGPVKDTILQYLNFRV